MRVFMLAVFLFIRVAMPTHAAPIDGQDDPAFQAAVTLWLQDDEAASLPQLSVLAAGGNMAAQVLIGLIDKTTALQGPWLALLSKPDRIALLRAKGGLSGTSWLRKADGAVAAQTMLAVLDGDTDIRTALKLAMLGEPGLARIALTAIEARQVTGFAAFASDPRFPDAMRYLIWREWQKAADQPKTLQAALDGLPRGDAQAELIFGPVARADLEHWLDSTDLAAPLRALCQARCPGAPPRCMHAGLQAIGGYRRLVTLGSPMAALISEARFAASPRGQNSVLRRAVAYANLTQSRAAEISATDTCFGDVLRSEGQRF